MKLDKAFAEDIELSITAQEADNQFAEGKIKSKFSFQCPDENCDAPVTCANLDRRVAKILMQLPDSNISVAHLCALYNRLIRQHASLL